MNHHITRTFVFILLLFNIQGYSQVNNFKIYDEDSGLPQNYVYSVSQSDEGFLYVSTGNGFATFEGNKFKTFTTKDSLCENFVNIHYIDSRGITWLGHYQLGISFLKDSKISKVKNSAQFGSKVLSFAEDKKKNIWFTVQGKGVFYIDSSFTIQHPSFTDDLNVNCLCMNPAGDLLCGTDNGIYMFNINDAQKPRLICQPKELENKSVKFIIRDALKADLFWIAVPGEGVYGIKQTTNCYQVALTISSELRSGSKNILGIYSDHSSDLWISLAEEGLKKIIFSDNSSSPYSVLTINKKNGLPNLYVQSIFEDFEGNMWFGTFGAGLIELPVERFSFFKPEFSTDIQSILIDETRNIWLGSTKGLILYNAADSAQSKLYDSRNGFVNDQVNFVFQDNSGTVWIGTEQNGIFTLNTKTGKIENFSKKNDLDRLSVNCITQSKDGRIIIGTKEGVYFIDPTTSKTILVTTQEGLLHNDIQHIFCDSKNRIWFSSHGTPPNYLKNNEFTVLKDIPELKTFDINSVAEDRSGLIWIATEGDGVFRYNGTDIKNFRVDDGLLSNFCYSVICSNDNDIWITHKNGLSCIKRAGRSILGFNKTEGLLFVENNLNASFKDGENLWFGTTEGIVKYNSVENKIRKLAPRTKILFLTLNGKPYSEKETIDLPYSEYSTRIDFIGISLTDPAKVNYKYRLLGLDTAWRFTNDRFVEYSKISDGNYTFQLLACNRDGIWNTTPAEIYFQIGLPVWKKVWFWFLAICFFIAITYFLIRVRTKKLLQAKQVLEKKIEIKTQQLRLEKEHLVKIKIILEEKNKDITDSINYAKRIQESLLPANESLLNCFPRSFIYYKPRDIVSGDFYWFAETNDSYIIAVVDCTGHGIPGAFMSLIGSTLINEIVNSKKITTPSQILTELHANVVKALRQDGDVDSSWDGMDISICSINRSKTKMFYSSAARPMYYVRNGALNEINMKTLSIGGSYGDLEKTYHDMEIELFPDDIFYLFSDGFADQFDSTNKKKFSSKKLKQLLTTISELDPAAQLHEIDSTFNSWKGDQRQIDDVTIIGFKI